MVLPSGTVVFLFTDIEGSTRRWETDGAAMVVAVERHLALLREAVAARGGVLYKTVGDGTQSAFASASTTLAAAVAAQRALHAEAWPEVVAPIAVRMAVHAGEARPRDGDYLAAPLNRLARLLSVTEGGQILLTHAVQQLVRDDLPAGAELRDLGEHRLRDLDLADRVFQYLHPDLPRTSAPAFIGDRRVHRLPAVHTPLLGRTAELEGIVSHLRDQTTRLLTLTGPGGVGKTRLALAAAERVLTDFPDGVVFVDLAPLRDAELVPSAIAAALGVREGAGRAVREVIGESLSTRHTLLMLDNFEHLLEATPFVGELLGAAPHLKILVTSRQRLALAAEQEMPIAPLAVPDPEHLPPLQQLAEFDAVRLFVARAQRNRPDFALTEANAAAVAAICHRLDGLPLALELAAARIKILSPAALLARLETRLPLLTGGARDLPARQRTLHDAIAWSHDLLSPEEQALFRQLGVFAGGWTLEAVAAVAQPRGEHDVLGGVASLADQSLVHLDEHSAEPRYRLLQVVHEFAEEQLTRGGDEATVRDTHADWYLGLAERLRSQFVLGKATAFRAIAGDRDNLRQALAWFLTQRDGRALQLAASLGDVWWFRGEFAEGRRWLTQALAQVTGETPGVLHSAALFYAGALTIMQGDLAEAAQLAAQALTVAQDGDDRAGIANASFLLGYAALLQDDAEQAATWAEDAVTLTRASDDAWLPWMLILLGEALSRQGDVQRAEQTLQEAWTIFSRLGSEWGEGHALYRLAVFADSRGDLPRASQLYERSLQLRDASDDRWGFIEALVGLADFGTRTDQPEAAARLLGAADAFGEELGYVRVGTVRTDYQQSLGVAKDHLDADTLAQALAAGRTLARRDAIREASAIAAAARAGGVQESGQTHRETG